MDMNSAEKLAQSLLFLLVEKNCSDLELENAKALLMLFIIEKRIPSSDIKIFRVNHDAVLLKSQKIMEKQFPLVYFIAHKKFLGFNEFAGSDLTPYFSPAERGSSDAVDSLRSFFRGCELLLNSDVMEALSPFQEVNKRSQSGSTSAEDVSVSYASQLIENSLWKVKWVASSAWSSLHNYYGGGGGNNEEKTSEVKREPPKGNSRAIIDIPVVKTNWYGRSQKRIYRFHGHFFERIDPQGKDDGTEIVKATFDYSEVDRLELENGQDLSVFFSKKEKATQWMKTPEANRIAAIIRSRVPMSQNLPRITRNLEMKMSKLGVFTLRLNVGGGISGFPRWSRDGLRLAFQDSSLNAPNNWKVIDLEQVHDIAKEECNLYDVVNKTEEYLKRQSAGTVGFYATSAPSIPSETVTRDFYDYSVHMVPYSDAFGCRTVHGGIVSEIIDSATGNCSLFVTKSGKFGGQWRLRDQKLQLFDNKGGAPVCSPDGKYVAFVEKNSEAIVIHRIGDIPTETLSLMEASDDPSWSDPENVIFDATSQRQPAASPSVPIPVATAVLPIATSTATSPTVSAPIAVPMSSSFRSRIPSTIPTALHVSRESGLAFSSGVAVAETRNSPSQSSDGTTLRYLLARQQALSS
eukprot:TRINITY_DN7118_c0_g1_i1.p1 TRINITY_DN7118_c0_g1~~TRINITY_DN7118_c0_g1_i1.p1  ORF type:complete len:633 (-),score=143.17 TRINITY_DN7118_c0_g1_i1:36-1934(-)